MSGQEDSMLLPKARCGTPTNPPSNIDSPAVTNHIEKNPFK